jgi:hypothetical protein
VVSGLTTPRRHDGVTAWRHEEEREQLIAATVYVLARRGARLDWMGSLRDHTLDQVVDAVLTAQEQTRAVRGTGSEMKIMPGGAADNATGEPVDALVTRDMAQRARILALRPPGAGHADLPLRPLVDAAAELLAALDEHLGVNSRPRRLQAAADRLRHQLQRAQARTSP